MDPVDLDGLADALLEVGSKRVFTKWGDSNSQLGALKAVHNAVQQGVVDAREGYRWTTRRVRSRGDVSVWSVEDDKTGREFLVLRNERDGSAGGNHAPQVVLDVTDVDRGGWDA